MYYTTEPKWSQALFQTKFRFAVGAPLRTIRACAALVMQQSKGRAVHRCETLHFLLILPREQGFINSFSFFIEKNTT
ncbi:MAG: hypothetical protein ACI3V0_03695 [Faecousia sp.]